MDDQSKKTKKVVTGPVARRKRKQSSEVAKSFQSAWDYVLSEVLLPAARDMFYDGIVAGTGKMVYQEDRPRTSGPRGLSQSKGSYTSYNRYSNRKAPIGDPDEPRRITKRARATHDFDEIVLTTRKEAEDVLDAMFEHLLEYDVATVSDLYDKLGIQPQYTDDNWGWTDIRGSGIRRIRGGYILEFPQPTHLE